MSSFAAKVNDALVKAGLQPVNKKTALYFYMPIKGCVNYVILGTQMFSPELYENFQFLFIPKQVSLTNVCLMNSAVGAGLYLSSRPHMEKASPQDKVLFCAFGSVMFNLGSMLLWALGRTVVPENLAIRTVLGVGGTVGAIVVAKKYIEFIDSKKD